MFSVRVHILFVFFTVLSSLSLLKAEVTPRPGSESLPSLFSAATLVFKGEVLSVTATGQGVGEFHGQTTVLNTFGARMRIDRLYKGAIGNSEVLITYSRPAGTACSVAICEQLTPGEYDLFFIVQSAGGYRLINPHWGKFPVSKLNGASAALGLETLEHDLEAGFSDSDELRRVATIGLFGALEHVSSTAPLVRLYTRATVLERAAIQDALLRLGDHTILSDAKSVFGIPDPESRLRSLQYRIAFQVSGIRSPKAVPALIALATSSADDLRGAAVHALRESRSPVAVPILIAALDDPVVLTRYDALYGLCSITGRCDAPSVDLFARRETAFIVPLKSWWADAGKAQYAPAQR